MNSVNPASIANQAIEAKKTNNVAYLHGNIEILQVSQIKCNVKTQQRTGLNLQTIEEYKEAISLGAKFPPVKVCFDGENYYLWDGFHTVQVYSQLEKTEIEAEVSQGTLRDAILLSVGANYSHGLRRTREDKRKAVLSLLYDEEWSEWSNREIARRCKVDHKTVSKIRSEITYKSPSNNTKDDKSIITGEFPSDNPKKYIDRYGNQSVMDTKSIGTKSNTKNDDTIITAFKRSDNPINDKKIITGEKRTNQKVEITSDYRKGEQGIITQEINANGVIIKFPDGSRETFQKWHYKMIDDKLESLVNLASQGFERQKINFQENDIVLIDPTNRVDDRLVGYAKRYAQIIKLNDHSADVTIWGKTIEAVSLTDLTPIPHETISIGVSIKPRVYAQLMANFSSLEEALDYAVSKKSQHPGFSKIFN